jgi:chorismate synthase
MKGSQHNDSFIVKNDKVVTAKNLSGGILGGISTGEDIYFNVAFKPISGIKQKQTTLDRNAATVEFETSGRHDVCMVPRAVPIVAAMTGLVLMDSLLKNAKYV